jgi:hypothetical protein
LETAGIHGTLQMNFSNIGKKSKSVQSQRLGSMPMEYNHEKTEAKNLELLALKQVVKSP